MFIIFGWEKRVDKPLPLLDTYCYRCKKAVTWDLLAVREWVSLFFIRVLPFHSQHFLACGRCGDYFELNKQQAREIKLRQRLSPQASQQLHDQLVQALEQHQLGEMSETQVQWHRMKRGENESVE